MNNINNTQVAEVFVQLGNLVRDYARAGELPSDYVLDCNRPAPHGNLPQGFLARLIIRPFYKFLLGSKSLPLGVAKTLAPKGASLNYKDYCIRPSYYVDFYTVDKTVGNHNCLGVRVDEEGKLPLISEYDVEPFSKHARLSGAGATLKAEQEIYRWTDKLIAVSTHDTQVQDKMVEDMRRFKNIFEKLAREVNVTLPV